MHLAVFALLAAAPGEAHWYDRVDVSGFVDVYYAFDSNRPLSGDAFALGVGTSAKRANEFSLNLAAIDLAMDPAPGQPVTMRLVLNYGTATEVLHKGEPAGAGIGSDVFKFVQQAYVGYLAGWVLIEAGIFPCHVGFETLQSKDNWTYTRAWMSEFSPYYSAGVRAVASLPVGFTAGLFVLNGWQIVGENDDWKTVGTHLGWARGKWSIAWNTMAGPEGVMTAPGIRDDGGEWRLFSDLIIEWDVLPRLQLAATWDIGAQQRPVADAAVFHGGAAYIRTAILPSLFFVVRGEYYHDERVFTTLTDETLTAVTATFDIRAAQQLIVKVEGRYDHSSQLAFDDHPLDLIGMPQKARDQTLFVVSAVASF